MARLGSDRGGRRIYVRPAYDFGRSAGGGQCSGGIASAIGGGYAFIRWFGENDYGQTISLCGAVVVCAVVLWCLSFIFRRNGGDS